MYEYFRGKLVEIAEGHVVVDVLGVGYRLPVPLSHISKLPPLQSEVVLYASFVVREASQNIYAFITKQERDLFEILINLSGIGPKMALALIGHMNIQDLNEAVQNNNIAFLSKVPGIGKKTAERLVIELKDKLKLFSFEPIRAEIHEPSIVKDALNALMNLGFQQTAAQQAIKRALLSLPENVDLATLIGQALRPS